MARVFISAVTEGELRFGVARRPGATKLEKIVEEFLLRVTILPWDSNAARQIDLVVSKNSNASLRGQTDIPAWRLRGSRWGWKSRGGLPARDLDPYIVEPVHRLYPPPLASNAR